MVLLPIQEGHSVHSGDAHRREASRGHPHIHSAAATCHEQRLPQLPVAVGGISSRPLFWQQFGHGGNWVKQVAHETAENTRPAGKNEKQNQNQKFKLISLFD